MSFVIKIPNATFDSSKAFSSLTLPDRTSLVGEFILGGTAASSTRNRANVAAPASLVNGGSITYASNYATVLNSSAGSYGFDTGINPSVARTVIAISSRNIGFACHAGFGDGSVGLWNDWNTGVFSFSNNYTNGATDQAVIARTPPADDSTTMFFQAGSGATSGVGKLYVGKSGVLVTDSGTSTSVNLQVTPYKIGAVDNAAFGGGTGTVKRVAYAAIFERILSDAEVQKIYTQLTAFYANRGLAVN